MCSPSESHSSESTSLLLSTINFAFHIFEKTLTFGVVLIYLPMTKSTNQPVSAFSLYFFSSKKNRCLVLFFYHR